MNCIIDFVSKQCKNYQHDSCHGEWVGYGLQFNCDCNCHKEKNNEAEEFQGPNSAALKYTIDEDFNNG